MSVRGNILVADDDAAIRTVLNQALSRVGHDVRVLERRRSGDGWRRARVTSSSPTW